MKFCTNCGHELVKNAQFCIACGAKNEAKDAKEPLEKDSSSTIKTVSSAEIKETTAKDKTTKENLSDVETDVVVEEVEEKTEEEKQEAEKAQKEIVASTVKLPQKENPQASPSSQRLETQSSNRKRNILFGIVAFIIVVLFGVHKGLESYFDPMKDLIAMDEAITAKDEQKFLSYIEFDKDALLDEASYFEIVQEMWTNTLRDQLVVIVEEMVENKDLLHKEVYDPYDAVMFTVQKDSILGLYNRMQLVATPFELTVSSNLDEYTVTLLDEEIEVDRNEDFPLAEVYPGKYPYKAEAQNEFGTFSIEDELELLSPTDQYAEIIFEAQRYPFSYQYGYDDATLYIDGKPYDGKVSELEELGPFPTDSDAVIYMVVEDDNEYEIVSNIIHLKDYDSFAINFSFDSKNKIARKGVENVEVAQFLLAFREAYEDAVNFEEYEYIEGYLKDKSDVAKELKKFIKDMEDGYYYYDFTENIVTNVEDKGKGKYIVEMLEKFEFRDDDFKWYDYERIKEYTVETVEDELKIVKIDYKDTKKKRI